MKRLMQKRNGSGVVKGGCAALLTGCLLLGGCALDDSIPEMSEGEKMMVEEYAAQLVLKYDPLYDTNILTPEQMESEIAEMERRAQVQVQIQHDQEAREAARQEQEASEQSGNGSGSSGSAEVQEVYTSDIDEFLGLSGIQIDYAGCFVADSYPQVTEENDWQGVVKAGDGASLIVFQYNVRNESGGDYFLDLASQRLRVTFRLNEGGETESVASLMTLLRDDMLLYCDTIPAGESRQMVLVVETSADKAAALGGATMTLKRGDDRMMLTLF